jgi:hypothetical protein
MTHGPGCSNLSATSQNAIFTQVAVATGGSTGMRLPLLKSSLLSARGSPVTVRQPVLS